MNLKYYNPILPRVEELRYTSINNFESDMYFYHSDHLGSSSWITDASGAVNQHLQYLPPDSYRDGEHFVNQTSTSWETPYKFSGKEKDDETGYSYFGARYYDSDLSIWLSVDPMSDKYPSTSSFMYVMGNPVMLIDPNGMFATDIYDINSGEHLEHIDDGIDEAVAINKLSYNALKSDNTLNNNSLKEVGGVSLGSNTDFNKITSSLYGEMDWKSQNPDYQEAAAMYDVLLNRANENQTSVVEELEKPNQVYGYNPKDKNSNYNFAYNQTKGKVNISRLNAAREGVMLAMMNENDYSNGANGWDGRDLAIQGSRAYRDRYEKGFLFTSDSHDIFSMGSNKVNGAYKFMSTAAFGATIFRKEIR